MLPPRLLRPLRPWHLSGLSGASARVRWLATRPPGERPSRRGDGAPGGGEPEPATPGNVVADGEAPSGEAKAEKVPPPASTSSPPATPKPPSSTPPPASSPPGTVSLSPPSTSNTGPRGRPIHLSETANLLRPAPSQPHAMQPSHLSRPRKKPRVKGERTTTYAQPNSVNDPTARTTDFRNPHDEAQGPASRRAPSWPGNGKPTTSSTDTDTDLEDMQRQLHQLHEKAKLLSDRIAAQTGSDGIGSPVTPGAQSSTPDAKALSQTSPNDRPPINAVSSSAIQLGSNDGPARRYEPSSQAKSQNQRLKIMASANRILQRTTSESPSGISSDPEERRANSTDGQRLGRHVHDQTRLMKSPQQHDRLSLDNRSTLPVDSQALETSSPASAQPSLERHEVGEQSLLDELFPEASNFMQPHYSERNPYPKLSPPSSTPLIQSYVHEERLSTREKYKKAFQRSAEKLTALQLLHCSTELTEADFRSILPKGKHIEGWERDSDLRNVIPGRDPLSLQRLPFYYLIFKNHEAALAYRSTAHRLHKLSKLYGPSNSFSAIPPPPRVLEQGQNLNALYSSYLLAPTSQDLHLNLLVQPYNSRLARLFEHGGYAPITQSTSTGEPIHKVLIHIEGYEPSPYDLYQILMQDATARGFVWPFLREHQSIHRLRDIIDPKTSLLAVSSHNPRASTISRLKTSAKTSHDPYASFLAQADLENGDEKDQDTKAFTQVVMERMYNRWVVEFSEEAGARRFARLWHRKVLPMQDSVLHRTWRDVEEARMCNAEYLW